MLEQYEIENQSQKTVSITNVAAAPSQVVKSNTLHLRKSMTNKKQFIKPNVKINVDEEINDEQSYSIEVTSPSQKSMG